MDHVLSTHLFVQHRLTASLLSKIENAGIPAVEIFCARQHIDYRNKAQVTELGYWFRDSKLRAHSMHAPFFTDEIWGRSGPDAAINICEREKPARIKMVDEIKWAIEIAETIPFRYLVQHLGGAHDEWDEYKVDAAFSSLEELMLFARHRGVEILLENIPNGLSSAERLMDFVRATHLKLNFVFDTGHANIMASVADEFDILKERIRSTHVHDNNGVDDKHLFPLVAEGGTIDWKRTMGQFRACKGQFPLVLELKEVPDMEHPLDRVAEVFDRLENLRDDE